MRAHFLFRISERRHEWFRSSLDHVLTDQLDDIRESDEDGLGTSSHSEDELDNRKYRNDKRNKPEVDQASSEGLDSMDSDIPEPRRLHVKNVKFVKSCYRYNYQEVISFFVIFKDFVKIIF